MTSGFMCYVNQNGVQKGIICSMYTHNIWSDDLTSHDIELHYEIASDLAMRYLVFAISSNNYEWEVLHVQDSTNNAIAHVTIPDKYDGTVKLGIKLYDTAPTVGAILNVGFDYVVTGGINMPVVGPNDKIQMTCATPQATIYYTLDGSTPSASKTKYSVPFSVDKSCTIKAIGVKSGLNNSAVSTLEVEYQGGEVNPPTPTITEEVNMIKKSFHIAKPENSGTDFTCAGANDFLIECYNSGELVFGKVKINTPYGILVAESGYIMPANLHFMGNATGGNLVIYFFMYERDSNYTPICNSIQITGDSVKLTHGKYLYEEGNGIASFDIVLYFEE